MVHQLVKVFVVCVALQTTVNAGPCPEKLRKAESSSYIDIQSVFNIDMYKELFRGSKNVAMEVMWIKTLMNNFDYIMIIKINRLTLQTSSLSTTW